MKFTINREKLLEPLHLACGVVERKQTAPILSNILLCAEGGSLVITSSDEEVELTVTIAEVSIEDEGEVTVPARKLMDICRSLPDNADMTACLDGNRVAIDSGRFSSYLATLPSAEFPSIEVGSPDVAIPLPVADLRKLLQRTSFAMAQQDVRYFFNGVLLEVEDETVRFVATNGQRLATSHVKLEESLGSHQFIIPRKAVGELSRILDGEDTVSLNFTSSHMLLERPGLKLITKLIDATYPDYTRAIPTAGNKMVVADRQLLKEALSRTAILSNELYRNVRLIVMRDKLDMHANNPQQEEAEESIAVEYDGETLEIGFNVSYLIEALSVMQGEKVRITLMDATSACVLEDVNDTESLYVISPMVL
ncbi:MAG: DNA polymerase III subunit beta [Gammaproteobacteria bacterium]|jgi:DNA polymerase III subunit beta|nr:DNA polymerase III subunit beta [Gammaproteobacteria bacterium]MBT4494597.1 DNA polymerase III subunit beta [Gammaproteobacteria bacterium]MBT7370745.1 DNA polymerase III subunit beta [Gammaproteobacteria bacterium]